MDVWALGSGSAGNGYLVQAGDTRVLVDCGLGIRTLEQRLADGRYLRTLGTYDFILANILSSVIIPLLPAFLSVLNADGHIVVAGILQAESDAFVSEAERAGFDVITEDCEEEWWAALLRPSGSAARAGL